MLTANCKIRPLVFDPTRSYGTPRNLMALGRMEVMGWRGARALHDGIARNYADWLAKIRTLQYCGSTQHSSDANLA